MPPQTGYSVPDIAALKAILSADRTDGYARLVIEKNAWYLFRADRFDAGNDDTVIVPDDSPESGRFIKSGGGFEWLLKGEDYTCNSGDKIVVNNINGIFSSGITLPSNPSEGDAVELLIIAPNFINIQLNGRNYKGSSVDKLEISTPYRNASLIYFDSLLGWIPTNDDLFTPVSGGGGGEVT